MQSVLGGGGGWSLTQFLKLISVKRIRRENPGLETKTCTDSISLEALGTPAVAKNKGVYKQVTAQVKRAVTRRGACVSDTARGLQTAGPAPTRSRGRQTSPPQYTWSASR